METKKIYILLTRFPGWHSRAIQIWTRFPYTHASVGLEEDLNTFYSFVYKGFIVESIARYNKPGRAPMPCALYCMEVSQDTYYAARQILYSFQCNRAQFHYSRLGVLAGLILRIPLRRENHYFCSQFVADVLSSCRALRLEKDTTLYLPKDFSRNSNLRMVFRGDLLRMAHQFKTV